jgi:hypothetical protein
MSPPASHEHRSVQSIASFNDALLLPPPTAHPLQEAW